MPQFTDKKGQTWKVNLDPVIADVEDNKVRVPSAKVLQGYFKTASERPQQQPIDPLRRQHRQG